MEGVFEINFALDISGQLDPNSTTTVSLVAMDDTASK